MKILPALYLGMLGLSSPTVALTDEAWILVQRDTQFAIERVNDGTRSTIAALGNIVAYGDAKNVLALLSGNGPLGRPTLTVFDKSTARAIVSWPVAGHPTEQLAGPSNNIVLTNTFAFYATIRFGADGRSIEVNEKGGNYDLNRLNLSDGTIVRYPLPKECRYPRLIDYSGTPLIYSWSGGNAWQFDAAKGTLRSVLTQTDFEDTVVVNRDTPVSSEYPRVSPDYVGISGVGMFRLSEFGVLSHVLNADLSSVSEMGKSLEIGSASELVRVVPARFENKPSIGVIRGLAGSTEIKLVDPELLRVQWQSTLPKETVPASIFVSNSGDVYFVDRERAAVRKIASDSTTSVLALDGESVVIDHVRILFVKSGVHAS